MKNEFCFVKDKSGGYKKVSFEDLLFVKSLGNYLQFVTINGTFIALGALSALESELSHHDRFARVHKSYFVNIQRVEHLSPGGLLVGGHEIPVGGKFMENIKETFILQHVLKL